MRVLHVAVTMTRLWIRLYTWRMDPEMRDRRRAEVESDLFEQLASEGDDPWLPPRLIVRLLTGVHNDLAWRLETAPKWRNVMRLRIAFTAAAMIVAISLWSFLGLAPAQPPDPPEAPRFRSRLDLRPMPPPPPPPPPICTPPGISKSTGEPCRKWP